MKFINLDSNQVFINGELLNGYISECLSSHHWFSRFIPLDYEDKLIYKDKIHFSKYAISCIRFRGNIYFEKFQYSINAENSFRVFFDINNIENNVNEPLFYSEFNLRKAEFVERRTNGKYNFIYFNKAVYMYDNSKDNFSDEEICLLIKEYTYKKEKKFTNLKKQIEYFEKLTTENLVKKREPIPEDVRFEVWRRDLGRCVQCGSKENLEFDHIIPFSKGGSNTSRNLQLLCRKCNREKSDKI